jgi:hypothetical protein
MPAAAFGTVEGAATYIGAMQLNRLGVLHGALPASQPGSVDPASKGPDGLARLTPRQQDPDGKGPNP